MLASTTVCFFLCGVLSVSGEGIDLPTGFNICILDQIGMPFCPNIHSLHPTVCVDFVAATHQLAHNLPTNEAIAPLLPPPRIGH